MAGEESDAETGEEEGADSEKPGPSAEERQTYAKWLEQMVGRKDEVHKQLKVLFEAHRIAEEKEPPEGLNALGLLARAKELVKRRESFDEPLGRVLYHLVGGDFMWLLGFSSFGEYCRDRLGISESTARQRIRLERRMRELPPLRQALISGKLTYTKAIEVSRHATRRDVEERIRDAAGTTYQQTKQVADEEEERRDRERGERKVRSPRAAQEVILAANRDLREHFAKEGEEIDGGEAFIRLHSIFFEKWEKPLKRSEWRTAAEKGVMMRHGGLCAVPGCTRAAQMIAFGQGWRQAVGVGPGGGNRSRDRRGGHRPPLKAMRPAESPLVGGEAPRSGRRRRGASTWSGFSGAVTARTRTSCPTRSTRRGATTT